MPSLTIGRPEPDEAAPYYFGYIRLVEGDDPVAVLEAQSRELPAFLETIPEGRSRHRYAPEKWSVREVWGHVNDTERILLFRALWFARGFESPLPSFDQEGCARVAGADARSWASLVDEFRAVRQATLTLVRELPPPAWTRRGVASGNPFSVRALIYLLAGHATHHAATIRERYLG